VVRSNLDRMLVGFVCNNRLGVVLVILLEGRFLGLEMPELEVVELEVVPLFLVSLVVYSFELPEVVVWEGFA